MGFSLVSAIFVLLVLAALAGYLVTVSGVHHTGTLLAQQGMRAHFAAQAGVEWAIHEIVNNGAAGLDCSPGTTSFTLGEASLAGFDVNVQCAVQSITEGSVGDPNTT